MRNRWGADKVLSHLLQKWHGFVVDFAVAFWTCKQRVSGGENISEGFSPPTTTVQWDPRKSPWTSPFQNLFLAEVEFHGNFVCSHLSLQISPATFFAANFAGKSFRQRQFFASAVFRRRRFSPAAFSCCAHPSAALQNTNSALLPPFQKASKATPSYFCVLCRYWWKVLFLFVYHDYRNRNCMLTTHSNFRILQLKFFAGVSLCRLVAITLWPFQATDKS